MRKSDVFEVPKILRPLWTMLYKSKNIETLNVDDRESDLFFYVKFKFFYNNIISTQTIPSKRYDRSILRDDLYISPAGPQLIRAQVCDAERV